MSSIRDALPPIYRGLVDGAVFDHEKPSERRATCEKCAMCDHGQGSPVEMDFFLHDLKCCSYFPGLPNYLVGAILSDPDPAMDEGKKRIRARIATRIGVTPQALTRPRKLTLLMQSYGNGFGRAKSLRCPYFNAENLEASCSIWRHRETVCQTYYCKYEGGKRGYDFWVALKEYLAIAQHMLASFAHMAVAPEAKEPSHATHDLSLEDIEDLPPKDYDTIWGSWVGREEEFYVACARWVEARTREEYRKNVDESEQGKKLLAELTATLLRLENKVLPTSLVRNRRMKEVVAGDRVVVTTYHRYDSFALDKELFEVVGRFDGDLTLEQNLARLREEEIELAPELIEFLFATGVLVESKSAGAIAATTSARENAVCASPRKP